MVRWSVRIRVWTERQRQLSHTLSVYHLPSHTPINLAHSSAQHTSKQVAIDTLIRPAPLISHHVHPFTAHTQTPVIW